MTSAVPSLRLDGKGAVVTGGNRGIGLGMARALAANGASVCIWGRDPRRNQAALAELREHGDGVFAFECDVADEAQVDASFAASVAAIGHVDACFVNAGFMPPPARLVDTTTDGWRRTLAPNLDGAFFTLRAAARHMAPRGSGSIVLTSSISAIDGTPRQYGYAVSKFAMVALARSAAVELGRDGIRVNAILPGWTDTEALDPMLRSDDAYATRWRAALFARVPLRRWGQPADIGGIAVYLASDASAWHTGDSIVIDGGYTAF